MGQEFAFHYTSESWSAAKAVTAALQPLMHWPKTVLDLGCGVGAWSKAFAEAGSTRQILVDHPSNQAENLLFIPSEFHRINLETELPPITKVDLAICVEVMEHLSPKREKAILNYLSETADVLLFSAAIPRQGGVDHVNEQPPNYWKKALQEYGYERYDCLRPILLHQEAVPYYFRQNLFLYAKDPSVFLQSPPANWLPDGFELVHDLIYERPLSLMELIRQFPAACRAAIRHRMG